MNKITIKTNGVGAGAYFSGPNVFVQKFVDGTRHNIVLAGNVDVLFLVTSGVGHFKMHNKVKKMVMRCDGMYYIHDEARIPKERNVGIIQRYNDADAHVFQSVYAKLFYEYVCGKRDVPSKIIYNGSSLPYVCKVNRHIGVLCSTDARESKRQYLISKIAGKLMEYDPKIEIAVIGKYHGKVISNMKMLGMNIN